MITFSSSFLSVVDSAIDSMNLLADRDHSIEAIREEIVKLGTHTEVFFKFALFPTANRRNGLNELINLISHHSMDQNDITDLHDFRRLYNTCKHETEPDISIVETVKQLNKFGNAVRKVSSIGLGISNRPVRRKLKRVVWLAGWDHIIGGDIEIHIILPTTKHYDFGPPHLEIIYTDALLWTEMLNTLKVVGKLFPGEEIIPVQTIEQFRGEGDFAGAYVFEGHYSELISVLANFEKRNDILPLLRRSSHFASMLHGMVLSTLDIAVLDINDKETFAFEISKQASEVYAIPEDYEHLGLMADSFSDMLVQVGSYRSSLVGPIWISVEEYNNFLQNSVYHSEKLYYLVNSEYMICMYHPDQG